MNKLSKILFGIVLSAATISVSGCSNSSVPSTSNSDDLSLASSSPYGDPIGTNPDNPYPVISEINNSLTVDIDYYKNDKDIAKTEKYVGIGRGFISNVKFAEGADGCLEYRIKKISQSSCSGKYSYKKLMLSSQSPALSDEFEKEPYLLEKNFRMESLVLDKDTFDVLMLVNETQTDKLASNGKIVDILLHSGKVSELDTPNIARGTATGKDASGAVATVGRSLREILEDCGQSTTSPLNPGMVGVIQQGPGIDSSDIIALNKKYSEEAAVPAQILIKSLASKSSAIKALNSGKSDSVDQFLADAILNKTWYEAGTSSSLPNHPPGSVFTTSQTEIKLDNLIDEFKGKIDSSAKTDINLSYAQDGTSYFNLLVEKDGKKTYHLYRPALYSPAKITSSTATTDQGLSVGKVDISQEEEKISSDPWCGFTPECKPAIYLYPEKTSLVNVKIGPRIGQRTITIPPYDPKTGWQVLADPTGTISWGSMSFTHLFYEAMTPYPKVPEEGWMMDGNNIQGALYDIGRQMGLNDTESKELGRYWSVKLGKSPYYYVGLIDENEIDQLEPIEVNPRPETMIRMRFYFAPTDTLYPIKNPAAVSRERKGFTVVEWGGYVR